MEKIKQNRIDELRKSFGRKFQAILVTDLSNIRYLCGYSGSSGVLLIGRDCSFFFTDFRYKEQAAAEIGSSATVIICYKGILSQVLKTIKKQKITKLAVENSMPLGTYLAYQKKFKGELIPVRGLVKKIRQIKIKEEEVLLKKAFSIADGAFEKLLKYIKPGKTEIEIAARLEFLMKQAGSSMPSFDTIVASGPNSSCPHAQPTNRKFKNGEMIKIDFGAVYNGYHSDMTRTIFLGKADSKFKKIYNIVLKAQKAAIKALKVGEKCCDIDQVARKIITDNGYGDNFGHGLGHSYGLDVHESPALASACKDIIKAGMTFTVEPGIYIPGWGGVRIEDSFLVKEKSLVRFTKPPNKLLEII